MWVGGSVISDGGDSGVIDEGVFTGEVKEMEWVSEETEFVSCVLLVFLSLYLHVNESLAVNTVD